MKQMDASENGADLEGNPSLEKALRELYDGKWDSKVLEPAYWLEQSQDSSLTVVDGFTSIQDSSTGTDRFPGASQARESLEGKGYFVLSDSSRRWGHTGDDRDQPSLAGSVERGMARLAALGWPPAFVFAYHQPWIIIDELFDLAADIMGTDDL
eukprot:CAMPEP_0113693092 /NCGR_PEP_ID=MMETSP0038_2-20120614/19471_1 /TAXON_ID=2898 /ORGANISM="Cryptomonas paramecium" /LENGTH=153 /DNA_ID=CAMNT_0000615123 /DNA_START=139 /DNA_END=596 /DNA_ORIENTATION=- /assembly_acc=CAM_ASM_000170